jgi:hypothetical protein
MTTMPSPAEFRAWSARARSFESISTLAAGGTSTMAGADGLAVLVPSMTVSVRFFDVLGVPPLVGRTFQDLDVTASPTALVLSEGMWRALRRRPCHRRTFGGLGGRAAAVIGVMPARAQIVPPFTAGGTTTAPPADLFTVGSFDARSRPRSLRARRRPPPPRRLHRGRTKRPGRHRARSRARVGHQAGHNVLVQPLLHALIGTECVGPRSCCWAWWFLLVMCCANLANLLLARTSNEHAARGQIGHGRRAARIAVQLLTESLTLAVLGGVALAVAVGLLRVAVAMVPPGLLPNALTIPFDGRVALSAAW